MSYRTSSTRPGLAVMRAAQGGAVRCCLKGLAAFLFTLFFLTAGEAQASFCVVPEAEGSWRNYDSNTRGITRLRFDLDCRDASIVECNGDICRRINAVDPHYFIRMYGSCTPTDCDWGRVEGVPWNDWFYFYYYHGYARKYVYVRTYSAWPGWLRLWMYTDFLDGRTDFVTDEWFRPG